LRTAKYPTKMELPDILEANCEEQLPPWFIETVVKSLRGELRRKPGRPQRRGPITDKISNNEGKISALPRMAEEAKAYIRA
jgi:hypothetical protein